MAGGGAERAMAMIANGISARGYPVDLVLGDRSGPYLEEIAPGVNIVDLKASRMATALVPLVGYLRTRRPSVVLSALTHANVTVLMAAQLIRGRPRIVVSERDAVFPPSRQVLARVVRAVTAKTYHRADAIVAVSEGVRSDVIRELGADPAKVQTVYNPLDLDEIARLATEPATHRYFQTPRLPVFLAVGRLEQAKRFDVLLEAFAKMRSATPSKLIIIGEGSLRDELTRLAAALGVAEDVDFPGFQRNPFAWMARCDVFVLSSRNEGLPNALIQAMACGARVVSTDCPHGPAEILEFGQWGTLVPVGDSNALADAMDDALHLSAPPAVRVRARDFSMEKAVSRYLSVMQPSGEG